MKRLFASSPGYERINRLTTMLHVLTNPQVHYQTREMGLLSVARVQAIDEIERELAALLDGGSAFYDWVQGR